MVPTQSRIRMVPTQPRIPMVPTQPQVDGDFTPPYADDEFPKLAVQRNGEVQVNNNNRLAPDDYLPDQTQTIPLTTDTVCRSGHEGSRLRSEMANFHRRGLASQMTILIRMRKQKCPIPSPPFGSRQKRQGHRRDMHYPWRDRENEIPARGRAIKFVIEPMRAPFEKLID